MLTRIGSAMIDHENIIAITPYRLSPLDKLDPGSYTVTYSTGARVYLNDFDGRALMARWGEIAPKAKD
jgi:hypothetical protein